jgi:hypothetical protein
MIPHTVYLSNTSGVKVGITRKVPSRWIDQGAIQALPILSVQTRLHSGLVEKQISNWMADKTNWRKMLKNEVELRNLEELRDEVLEKLAAFPEINELATPIEDAEPLAIHYPVLEYPTKIISHNLEKTPVVEGTLQGIKGQYFILDNGVLNIRKYTGYHLTVT